MEDILPKRPGQTWRSYQFGVVNNLFLHFPMGREPFDGLTYPDVGYYLGIAERLGLADFPDASKENSEFKTKKTPREFNQELWDVTSSLGIDLSVLGQKLNQWYLDENPRRDETLDEEICRCMIRIYNAMRERGYSRRDLVS